MRAIRARRAAHARKWRAIRARQLRQQAAFMRKMRARRAAHAARMRALRAKRMAIARAAKLRGAKKAACTTCGAAASNLTVKQTTVVNAAQTKAKAN